MYTNIYTTSLYKIEEEKKKRRRKWERRNKIDVFLSKYTLSNLQYRWRKCAKDEKENCNEKLLSLFNTRELRCPAF